MKQPGSVVQILSMVINANIFLLLNEQRIMVSLIGIILNFHTVIQIIINNSDKGK